MTILTRNARNTSLLAALPLVAGALIAGTTPTLRADPAPAAPVVSQPRFADIVEAVQPAVVKIEVTRKAARLERLNAPDVRPFGPSPFGAAPPRGALPQPHGERTLEGMGSGFVVDADGYVVTNHHVVEDAESIAVRFADGELARAEIVGTDPLTDLAVLRVDADRELAVVEFGDSERARVGDWIVAIGSPFGLGGSVTAGIISAVGRDIRSGPYDNYIQFDAPINRGNSGGPIVDETGRVVGVNTAIYSPTGGNIGIGFAIPARDAAHIVTQLRAHGEVTRGWLGVQVQSVDTELAEALGTGERRGALVADVVDGSPASLAGLAPGDLIVRFGDADVDGPRDLSRAVARTEPGAKVRLEVVRDGRSRALSAIVDRSETRPLADSDPAEPAHRDGYGLALAPLDDGMRDRLGLADDAAGALVVRIVPGSGAAEAGLRPGDLIVRVNRRDVADVEGAIAALESAKREAGRAALLVRRGPAQFFTTVNAA